MRTYPLVTTLVIDNSVRKGAIYARIRVPPESTSKSKQPKKTLDLFYTLAIWCEFYMIYVYKCILDVRERYVPCRLNTLMESHSRS